MSAAPVAIVLASNACATLPFASRSAMMPEPTTVATRSKVPNNSAANRPRRFGFTCFPDAVDFLLDCELIETGQGKAKKQANSAIKNHERFSKCFFNLFRQAFDCGGIWHSPMSGHWLSGPDGTHLLCSVIADREHKIHLRTAGFGEFAPILGPRTVRRKFRNFDLSKRNRMYNTPRMAPCTLGGEIRKPSLVHDGVGRDGTSRVAGAQKQNVVPSAHSDHLFRVCFFSTICSWHSWRGAQRGRKKALDSALHSSMYVWERSPTMASGWLLATLAGSN